MTETVFLLSSGWPPDDNEDVGVFSTVEKAMAAAPADVRWVKSTMKSGLRQWEAGVGEPWWINEYELDRAHMDADDWVDTSEAWS